MNAKGTLRVESTCIKEIDRRTEQADGGPVKEIFEELKRNIMNIKGTQWQLILNLWISDSEEEKEPERQRKHT